MKRRQVCLWLPCLLLLLCGCNADQKAFKDWMAQNYPDGKSLTIDAWGEPEEMYLIPDDTLQAVADYYARKQAEVADLWANMQNKLVETDSVLHFLHHALVEDSVFYARYNLGRMQALVDDVSNVYAKTLPGPKTRVRHVVYTLRNVAHADDYVIYDAQGGVQGVLSVKKMRMNRAQDAREATQLDYDNLMLVLTETMAP